MIEKIRKYFDSGFHDFYIYYHIECECDSAISIIINALKHSEGIKTSAEHQRSCNLQITYDK